MPWSSTVISRASSSTSPIPNMPAVFLSFPTLRRVCAWKSSPSPPSKFTKGSLSASVKTLTALSPPPPRRGRWWHTAHVFASGPEMRLKLSGNIRGDLVLLSPTSVVPGLPAPSSVLKETTKRSFPRSMISSSSSLPLSMSSWSVCRDSAGASPILTCSAASAPPPHPTAPSAVSTAAAVRNAFGIRIVARRFIRRGKGAGSHSLRRCLSKARLYHAHTCVPSPWAAPTERHRVSDSYPEAPAPARSALSRTSRPGSSVITASIPVRAA